MRNIAYYLEKFKKFSPPDDYLKNSIKQILESEMEIFIGKENIEIRQGVIYIKESPLIKNEIFLKKDFILEKIKDSAGKRMVKDIK